jgi:hypothetical protein
MEPVRRLLRHVAWALDDLRCALAAVARRILRRRTPMTSREHSWQGVLAPTVALPARVDVQPGVVALPAPIDVQPSVAAAEDREQALRRLEQRCAGNEDDLLTYLMARHYGDDPLAQRYSFSEDPEHRRGIDPPGLSAAEREELANRRAVDLLMANLTARQREQYTRHRYFDVIGGESGTCYRLWHKTMQNIEELDASGHRRRIWCVHPNLVIPDVLLAQKMALELFESEALSIAHQYSAFADEACRRY